jgi:hypothetical protein
VPDQGETVVQLATAQPGSPIGGDPASAFDTVPIPGAPEDVDVYVKKSVFPAALLRTKRGSTAFGGACSGNRAESSSDARADQPSSTFDYRCGYF